MEPTSPDDLDERYESLPWEQVRTSEPSDRRWMLIAAGAVVVVAVTASATRTLWPTPPLATPTMQPSTTAEPIPVPASATQSQDQAPELITEADLRAISPESAERAVAAHAEWFVSEWLTIDGEPSDTAPAMLPDGVDIPVVDESARSFVESVVTLSAREVRLGSWEVAVLVRSLSAFGDGAYVRIPARVFHVTVGLGDDGPFVSDLPAPGSVPTARATAPELSEEPAPVHVVDAAVSSMREAGLPDESTIATSRSGDLWRVTGVVRDQAGVPFVVAVWLDESGERVPVPG